MSKLNLKLSPKQFTRCALLSLSLLYLSACGGDQAFDSTLTEASIVASDADVWQQFVNAKKNGLEPTLPDFSYAGYRYGEEPIPDIVGCDFDVTSYGAVPNDGGEDRDAIQETIWDAERAGGGVVCFPAGRFLLNEQEGGQKPILIQGANIVLRGAGSGEVGTELFMRYPLEPNSESIQSVPPMIITTNPDIPRTRGTLATVTADARRETFTLKVNDSSRLQVGGHVALRLVERAGNEGAAAWRFASAFRSDPVLLEEDWKVARGEFPYNDRNVAYELHRIAALSGNTVTLSEPLHLDVNATEFTWTLDRVDLVPEFGIERLAFVGNFTEEFSHNKDSLHASGFTALSIRRRTDSWLRDVRFTNWSQAVQVQNSHAVTLKDVKLTGNPGHSSVQVYRGYGVLVTGFEDRAEAGYWHGPGVRDYTAGTVFHNSSWPSTTSFDLHARFPYATLYDGVEGGLTNNRGGSGGAIANLPNHLEKLVLWNFTETGAGKDGFAFWRTDPSQKSLYVVEPLLVGYEGQSTFSSEQLALDESLGAAVEPASLYEAQLEQRLGNRPAHLDNY